MTILLAILTGGTLGYFLERGDVCFHSTWRTLFAQPRKTELFKTYLLFLLISIPLVQGMIALGWIEPWIAPFAWQANILGGLLFGVGMVIASTCITGVFYKFGHGMLGMLVAFIGWSIGDIVTYAGPLAGVRGALNANPILFNGQTATLFRLNVWVGLAVLLVLGGITAVYLKNAAPSKRTKLMRWETLGVALALVMSAAWLLAEFVNVNYTFGTSGVPTALFTPIFGGGLQTSSIWIMVTLFSIIPGAYLAARQHKTLWVRGESPRRYAELGLGGLLMGVGAGIAGGCNLGHGMVGVSLLSIGSIVTTLAIVVGIFVADKVVKQLQ